MLSISDPDAAAVERLLTEQRRVELSYAEVGATAGELPDGYRHDRYGARLGSGQEAFQRARAGLRTWQAHRAAGVSVYPLDASLAQDTTVVLVIGLALIRAVAACRIVYVTDEPQRFGFAYGTLAMHPEQGEEAFMVERDADESVWFRITAFSRPHDPLARLGAPVARVVQRRVTNGYLRGLREYVG